MHNIKNKKVYNPSDKGKRKYVSSMRNRILAGLVAAVTAASPVMATAAELGGYEVASETDGNTESLDVNTGGKTAAETVTDNSGTVSVTTEVGNNENTVEPAESVDDIITKAEESESSGEKTETKFLFINLAKAKGGTVILNEGELDDTGKSVENRVRLVAQTGTDELGNETTKTLINIYDKDDVLIDSEDAADNANIYVCEVKTDDVVTVKVVADDGYVVSKYDLQDRLVNGAKIDVGFDKTEGDDLTVGEDANESSTSDKMEFSYPVFMKVNMALTIELEEKQEETADEAEKSESTDDVTDDTAKDEEAVDDADTAKDTDLTVDGEVAADDSKKDMDTDLTVDGEKTDEGAKDLETADGDAGSTESESSETSDDISGDTDNINTAEGDGEVTENVVGDDAGEDVNADESGSADEENTGESVEDVNSGEAENVDTVDMTGETHFIDAAENIGDLDPTSFSTARLIILSDDSNNIIDQEHVIGTYGNIYLLQYKSVEQAMNAYIYYQTHASAVEPDVAVEAAETEADKDTVESVDETSETESETTDISTASVVDTDINNDIVDFEISETINPIVVMNDVTSETTPIDTTASDDTVIALIDTGADESTNVIERVSLIDDSLSGGIHGNKMVDAITSENSDAKIVSVRVLGDNGKGTISSVVAGIEYAINNNVDIINLSLYTKATLSSKVLTNQIAKAINNNIIVVGAAGNDGVNVKNYVPGNIGEAYIIGACDENGYELHLSNYGDTVDYNVVGDSTSEAAARFSGYISLHGVDSKIGYPVFDKNASDISKGEIVIPKNDADDDIVNAADTDDLEEVTLITNMTDKPYPPGVLCTDPDNDNFTRYFTVKWDETDLVDAGSVMGYCMQGYEKFPEDGAYRIDSTDAKHKLVKLGNKNAVNKVIARALFYLYGGPGWGYDITYTTTTSSGKKKEVTANLKKILTDAGCSTKDQYFAMTHYILCYIYNGEDGKWNWNGHYEGVLSDKGLAVIKKIYNHLVNFDFPKVELSDDYPDTKDDFTTTKVSYKSIAENVATFTLPKGVTMVATIDGEQKELTGKCKIPGGTSFYLKGNPDVVSGREDTIKIKTTFSADYTAYKLKTSGQDIGFGYSAGKKMEMYVDWPVKPTPTPTPTPVPCQVYVTKHSTATAAVLAENEYSVGGAVFGIYSDAGCSQEIGRVTTGDNSVSNPLQLPCTSAGNYTYYVKELAAPAGHNLNTEVKSVNVSLPTDNGKWFNVDFWDAAKFSHIQIKKVASDGASWNDNLKGTEFSLYLGDTWLETISIQNSDFHAFQYGCLLGKTYTVKETKVMPGKIKSPDFNVTIDNEANYKPTYWYTVTNKDVPKVKVTKNVSEGNDNELLQLGYYSRANAVFEVYADAALQNLVGKLSTDENGETRELPLPCQTDGTYTYYVKETKAPDGHKITDTVKPVTVTLPQDAGTTKGVEFTDEPETDELTAMVKKASGKGNLIGDVVFKVCLYDGEYKTANECPANMLKKTWYLKSDEDGLVEFDKDHRAREYTSDSFYKDKNGDVIIPSSKSCTITYQEVKTPGPYVLNDTVNLWKMKGQTVDVEGKLYYNDITPCKISINKFKEDGKTPLRGVKFQLSFIKESEPYTNLANPSYKPLLKVGESTEGTTDANGNITWSNLDQGEYQITEIQTVSGMTLLKDPINITLPITMTDKQAKDMSAATDLGKFDNYTNKWYFYEATFDVTNSVSFKMPTTGADGVWKYIFFGFGTMAMLATGLIIYDSKNKRTRKRKRK